MKTQKRTPNLLDGGKVMDNRNRSNKVILARPADKVKIQPDDLQPRDEFFQSRYSDLFRYCRSRWNGNGQDVLHTAWIVAGRYEKINFSLFAVLAHEAARELRIHEWQHDDQGVILTPRMEKTRNRLALELATPSESEDPDDTPEYSPVELRAAKKLIRAEKAGQPCLWSVNTREKAIKGVR